MSDSLAETIEKAEQAEQKADPAPDRSKTASRRSSTGRKRTRKTGSSRSTSASTRSLKRPLEELLATVGTILSAINPVDGAIILARAEPTARALDDIAKANPSVHRVLSMLTTSGGGWVGVITALTPVILPIAHNHGLTAAVPMVDALAASMMPEEAQAMSGLASMFGGMGDLGDLAKMAEQMQADAGNGTPPAA